MAETTSGKLHDMRDVWQTELNEKFKSKLASLLSKNYNRVEFKERLPNQGDTTLFRKFEKRSGPSHREDIQIKISLKAKLTNQTKEKRICSSYIRYSKEKNDHLCSACGFAIFFPVTF